MGKEIERKFLVDHQRWSALIKPIGQNFRQGYLLTDPDKTIRVRTTSTKGFLTIKGKNVGATRTEFEYEIPHEEATALLDDFSSTELSKIRYEIEHSNKVWEVDVFLGYNEGLVVAEIELISEEESFEIPEWIAKEVTHDQRYYNSNLTLNPFSTWIRE
jgi:CYTH domain-containing protein